MRKLRYVIAITAVIFIAADALAWSAEVNKAILKFAEGHLSKKAKKEVVEILDAPLHSIKFAGKGECITRLDENGKSVTMDKKDAVVRLEEAIAVLSDNSGSAIERKEALHTAVEMAVDIHCPSNILIDKHHEKEDFVFGRDNGRPKTSRWYKLQEWHWRDMWHSRYHLSHGAFSAEMYIYDWSIATRGMAKKYKKEPVAPRKWAEKTGERVLRSLEIFQPGREVNMLEITKQEPVNDAAMHDAAFHLAALLNATLK